MAAAFLTGGWHCSVGQYPHGRAKTERRHSPCDARHQQQGRDCSCLPHRCAAEACLAREALMERGLDDLMSGSWKMNCW